MKEINTTFTKKKNLLDSRKKVKPIIQNGNFFCGSFPKRLKEIKVRNWATSRVLHSATSRSPP